VVGGWVAEASAMSGAGRRRRGVRARWKVSDLEHIQDGAGRMRG
jgi:hypothetical protein